MPNIIDNELDYTELVPADAVIEKSDAEIEDEAIREDADEQIRKIMSGFDDPRLKQYRLYVKKCDEDDNSIFHECFVCSPSALPITERLKREHGSGEYKITVRDEKGYFKKHITLRIAKRIDENITPRDSSSENYIKFLSSKLEAAESDNRQFITALLLKNQPAPTPPPPPVNYAEMMTAGAAMFTAVVAAIKPEKSGGIKEVLETVQLVKEMNGDGGDDQSWAGMLGQAVPALINAGQQVPQQPPQQPAQQPPEQPPERALEQKEEDDLNTLKYQLAFLVTKAANDADPATYADVILDSFPAEQIQQFIKLPNVFGYLVEINPAVGNYPGWFKSVIESVINGLEPDQEELNEDDIGQVVDEEKEKKREDEISSADETEKETNQ